MPAAPTGRSQFVCSVVSNQSLCREHFRLVLRCEGFPPSEPGQFVQIACAEPSKNGSTECLGSGAFLRRPFSLAGRRDLGDGTTEIDIIHRVVGVGTAWLAKLRVGDAVNILGPLGNRFTLPDEDRTAVLVGGGVGIPPMLYLAEKVPRAVAFVGATADDLLPLTLRSKPPCDSIEPGLFVDEFARHEIKSIISTDDGSLGFRGFVTQALQRWLETAPANCVLYTCGPEPMMKRVAEIGAAHNIPVQVAVERAMACGMGTCQSCCIRVRVAPDVDPEGWRYKLACTDGPIFPGVDLLW